jgi:hypothetical protein
VDVANLLAFVTLLSSLNTSDRLPSKKRFNQRPFSITARTVYRDALDLAQGAAY